MKPPEVQIGKLEEIWEHFVSKLDISEIQNEEMRKAFFFGAYAVIEENLRIKFIDRSNLLLKRKKECLEFFMMLGINLK